MAILDVKDLDYSYQDGDNKRIIFEINGIQKSETSET